MPPPPQLFPPVAGDVVVRVAVGVGGIVAGHFAAVARAAVGQLKMLRMMMTMLRMRLTTGSTTYQAHYEVLVVLMVSSFCVLKMNLIC